MDADYILALNQYILSLSPEQRTILHKLLVEMKRSQEESLFALEKEYLRLVTDRRHATIAALKANCADKSFVGEPLKTLQKQNEEELAAFLRVRVFEGWQMAQFVKQKERLIEEAAIPAQLFKHENFALMRTLMQILWENTK